jgi:peptidoglycan/LPS O-acetylase OafA/YrhL
MSEKLSSKRIVNLDLIRAIAICVVVIYHTVQMVGRDGFISLSKFTHLGQYGVDLFFVLSGFLIGNLYWHELIENGTVDIKRFILRRILRTYPPYLIALILSFIPVWINRHQSFDFGYLFFFQNYYERIPFFLVSWSLCIEEHFYIFLPPILYFIQKFEPRQALLTLLALAVIPLILRLLFVNFNSNFPFGYYLTATHFRFEGLLLGVAASHLYTYSPDIVVSLSRRSFSFFIIALTISIVPILSSLPGNFIYYFGSTIIALAFSLLVISLSKSSPIRLAESHLVKIIATSSYSIYLTHALVIHIILLVANKLGINSLVTWLMMIVAIFVIGYLFYILVEKSSLVLRDKLVPKINKDAQLTR